MRLYESVARLAFLGKTLSEVCEILSLDEFAATRAWENWRANQPF